MKITLFKMDNKLSVKFEQGLLEQTYKFRVSNELENQADLEKLVSEAMMQEVEAAFIQMRSIRSGATKAYFPELDNEFEKII